MVYDIAGLKDDLHQATSAMQASAISDEIERNQRLIEVAIKQRAERDATIVAGAEANIAQKELLEQQLEAAQKQISLLNDNYNKLKELFDVQVKANGEAQKELRQSRRFNIRMMVIAIIAMLAAIAGPIVTILVSK